MGIKEWEVRISQAFLGGGRTLAGSEFTEGTVGGGFMITRLQDRVCTSQQSRGDVQEPGPAQTPSDCPCSSLSLPTVSLAFFPRAERRGKAQWEGPNFTDSLLELGFCHKTDDLGILLAIMALAR